MNRIEREVIHRHDEGESIKYIAKAAGCSECKVCKILSSYRFVLNKTARDVLDLHDQGMNPSDIAAALGISYSTVHRYLPYCRGVYHTDHPTRNAINIRNMRARRKKTCLS